MCQSQVLHRANSCGVRTLAVLARLHSQVAALWASVTCELIYGAQSKAAKGDKQVLFLVSFRCVEGHLTTTSTEFLLRSFLNVLSIVKLL